MHHTRATAYELLSILNEPCIRKYCYTLYDIVKLTFNKNTHKNDSHILDHSLVLNFAIKPQ